MFFHHLALTAEGQCFILRSPEDFEWQKTTSPLLHPAAAWQKKNHSHLSNSTLRDSLCLQALQQLQFISATLGLASFSIFTKGNFLLFGISTIYGVHPSIHHYDCPALRVAVVLEPIAAGWRQQQYDTLDKFPLHCSPTRKQATT